MNPSLQPKETRRAGVHAWIVTVLAASLFVAPISFVAPDAHAQISPGKLSKSHSFLEGMSNCTKCHEMGAGPSVEKCLSCHKEIALSLDNRRGYHHRAVAVGKKPCFECHSEHAGADFDLVHWPDGIKGFRHAESGYDLEGKHRALDCRSCHKPEFIKEDLKKYQSEIDLEKTFLGLHRECRSCHADEHRGQLQTDCLACHVQDAWVPARGFDHERLKFPLAGKHRGVACERCHPTVNEVSTADPKDQSFVKYAGVASASCASCHKDAHAGRFGKTCVTCHRTSGWTELDLRGFDHERTRFALTGKHREVPCAKCHPALAPAASSTSKKQPFLSYAGTALPSCSGCHKDIHAGKYGAGCETCHRTSGWAQIVSANFDHNRTAFPLKGRHAGVLCEKCHGQDLQKKKPAFSKCLDCHADTHRGQFAKRESGGECSDCHSEDGFVPALFTIADHDSTRFSLADAHLAQPCIGCHTQVADDKGKLYRRYVFGDIACASCHEDIHAGQFARSSPKKSCEDCHRATRWADLRFDHDRDSSYPLVGAHRNVECRRCHLAFEENGKQTVRYRPIDTACKTCHPIENP